MSTPSKSTLLAGILCLMVAALLPITARTGAAQQDKSQATLQNGDTRLNYFVGTWKISRTVQPTVFGPGGKAEGTMKCEWVINGIVLTCLSEGTWPYGKGDTKGKMKVLQVFEYNPETKGYSIYGFDNTGDAESSAGSVEGNLWTFRSTEKIQGKTVNALWTFKEEGRGGMSTEFRVSTTGVAALRTMKPTAEGRNERVQ
jgi:hypothetical protein